MNSSISTVLVLGTGDADGDQYLLVTLGFGPGDVSPAPQARSQPSREPDAGLTPSPDGSTFVRRCCCGDFYGSAYGATDCKACQFACPNGPALFYRTSLQGITTLPGFCCDHLNGDYLLAPCAPLFDGCPGPPEVVGYVCGGLGFFVPGPPLGISPFTPDACDPTFCTGSMVGSTDFCCYWYDQKPFTCNGVVRCVCVELAICPGVMRICFRLNPRITFGAPQIYLCYAGFLVDCLGPNVLTLYSRNGSIGPGQPDCMLTWPDTVIVEPA